MRRNQALRALVRYSIRRDAPEVEVVDPAPEPKNAESDGKAKGSKAAQR